MIGQKFGGLFKFLFKRFAIEIDVESLPTNTKHVTSIDLAVDGTGEVICRIGIHKS